MTIKATIHKYSKDDEYVIKFKGSSLIIRMLTGILDLGKFSVKDRNASTVTVRATMKG